MFLITFCCNRKEKIDNFEDEYVVTTEEKKIELDQYLSFNESEDIEFESNRWKLYQHCINDLKEAEKKAHEIISKAKKNRISYLNSAEEAANEIVMPYYKLANEELKEIETSLNHELHIKSLENLLSKKEEIEESDIKIRMEKATSYLFSKICDVKLELNNPEYVATQIIKHKAKNKVNRKRHELRNKIKSWRSNSDSKNNKEGNDHKKKTRFDVDREQTISSIELDEDYSKIDNMYGASRVISSFNTIHIN